MSAHLDRVDSARGGRLQQVPCTGGVGRLRGGADDHLIWGYMHAAENISGHSGDSGFFARADVARR